MDTQTYFARCMTSQTGSGENVLKDVKRRHAGIKVVVPTNCTYEFYEEACKRAQADYFFDKSFQFMRVREVISKWSSEGSAVNRIQ